VVAAALALPAAPASAADDAGLGYVSLGSSFAAGPGIPSAQPGSPAACSRSTRNYPSVVARDLGANHTDVSCSGATTAHVLDGGQAGLGPQVDAVTADTRVVTVTIGGNDVNYLGSVGVYSCQNSGGSACGTVDRDAVDRAFGTLTGRLANVVSAVRSRAPGARVFFVSYFTLLPESGTCAGVPLTADQLAFERSVASRLVDATNAAASATGATVVDLAGASRGHDACSAVPWVEDHTPEPGRATYHPNEAGMAAAARLVEAALGAAGVTATGPVRSALAGAKCVDVAESGTANGTAVQLFGCNGTGAQSWTVVPGSGGSARALGGCLDVAGGGTANGTRVQLWECNGTAAQRWRAGANGSLVNPRSGRCLDVPNASTADRTRLQLFDCNGTAAQRWTPAG
jgi:lysophospholipase L1-like esterase